MTDGVWNHWWVFFFVMPFFFMRPWRRSRSRLRDLESRLSAPRSAELDDALRARLETIDQLDSRVAELENRLDFAERLLAERRSPELESPHSVAENQ